MRTREAPAEEREEKTGAWVRPVELATVHALTWLTLACAVGLLMALLLLVPELGVALGPLTYGRWAPLHLDLGLYGWLALPLVALLFRAYLPRDGAGMTRAAGATVHVWSASLVAGAASWLAGRNSGKLFLDWEGIARALFLANLLFLAAVLAAGLFQRFRTEMGQISPSHPEGSPATRRTWAGAMSSSPPPGPSPRRARFRMTVGTGGLAVLWLGLLAVPAVMAWATSPVTYPAVNPETGGPTGASLLGSTLGVIAIFVFTPLLLRLPDRSPETRRATREIFGALAVHWLLFAAVAAVSAGDRSHREPLQIAAVATLLVWAWLLPRWYRRFDWHLGMPAESRLWLAAFLAWGGLLLASAVPMFLPGLLDRIKFTNALVGHAHLAMSGMATGFAALLLTLLNRGTRLQGVLGDRPAFLLWQGGNAVHVAALLAAGALEAADPGVVFRGDPLITALYAVRAAAGAAMLAAACRWTTRALRRAAV